MAATSSSAGSSGSSAYDLSEEKTNGTRLARLLVDGGTDVLRRFLHSIYSPATLQHVLNNNHARLQKTVRFDGQLKKLFPPSGDPPDSETFDIALLHLLLREICHLKPPATGWHKKPADRDVSPEANITRIKWFRNELCHSGSTGIPNGEFEDKWNEISLSLEALEVSVHRKKIQALKTDSIDHDTRRVEEELEQWKKMQEQDSSDTSSNIHSCLPDKLPEKLRFGRSQEIQQVREIIQNGTAPVAVITGGPGFGKTTVATVVAHELAKTEIDRTVLFCSLLSKKTLNEVAVEMIHSCGASHTQVPEHPEQWLKDWSKQIQTQVTFVLDNADDVLDSDDRNSFLKVLRVVRMLSKQNVTYVITTRKTFKDAGMQTSEVRLNPLSREEAKQILVSRVFDQDVRQKLSKTDNIVELCGCVPLALCIVGSLLSDYTEEKLIENLEREPLTLLEDDQSSVEKAIETSFHLLTKVEQDAFILLPVFPGPFNSDAAEAVMEACLNPATLPISILRSLKNRSLVEQPRSRRYQMHPLIYAFAKKIGRAEYPHVLAGEKKACVHFMSRLADNAILYWSKDKCKESVESFRDDRNNFEHFLQVYAQARESQDHEIVNPCESFLMDFPQKCMYLEKCLLPKFYIEMLKRFLKSFESEMCPVHAVELLCLLGHEMRKIGDKTEYTACMDKAVKLYSQHEDKFETNPLSKVIYLHSYARLLSEKKVPDEPCKVYDSALRICEQKLQDHPERAATLLFAGRYHKRRKENHKAEEKLNRALALFKECLGEHFMTAQCFKAIADFLLFVGQKQKKEGGFEDSLLYYEKSMEMIEKLGMDGHKESILTLKNYGICHKIKGNYEEARNMFERAERVAERELKSDHMWKVMVKTHQALLFDEEGKEDEMVEAMKAGLAMCYRLSKTIEDLGNKHLIWKVLDRHHEKFPMDKYPC